MKFNSILIGSEDPKRLTEYYTRLFGAHPTAHEEAIAQTINWFTSAELFVRQWRIE